MGAKVIKIIPSLILILLVANCTNKINLEDEKILTAVKSELKLYPEERLIDLYKSYFQGYWGPGHLIPDSISAQNYLTYEMENAEEYDKVLWQPLAHYNQYYRLNLKFVKDGIIPGNEYLSAFIQSANNPAKPKLEDWKGEWAKVLKVIEENKIDINNYTEDKNSIDTLLASGNYVVHHSGEFVKKYYPHYRVIAKKYFEILSDKYIKR